MKVKYLCLLLFVALLLGCNKRTLGKDPNKSKGKTTKIESTALRKEGNLVIIEFPKNNLGEANFIPTPDDSIFKQRFNILIDTVILRYKKLISEYKLMSPESFDPSQVYPVKLSSIKNWESTVVNASAGWGGKTSDGFADWKVEFHGGLFRRPEISEDGFSLVICHEIGHLFGGYPFNREGFTGIVLGHAVESEADYFSTHACLRSLWKNTDNAPPYNGAFNKTIYYADLPKKVIDQCNVAWETDKDRQVCYRISLAGSSVGKLWGAMDEDRLKCNSDEYPWPCYPKFDTPDMRKVDRTDIRHLNAQCRLDTYFSGALCSVDFENTNINKLIPGIFNHLPENSVQARDESLSWSCVRPPRKKTESVPFPDIHHPIPNGNIIGARPRCWFEPYDINN